MTHWLIDSLTAQRLAIALGVFFLIGPYPQAQPPVSSADQSRPQSKPLLAEQVYNNIELMKGKPATAVLPMMLAMRDLLGVDCNYCHTPHSWASDEKKTKLETRMMFHLTEFINNDLFAGKERVNCWTCHRGQPKAPAYPAPASPPPERRVAEMMMHLTDEQQGLPAAQVFKNIQSMKDVPAGQFPVIMAYFSRSLGVKCNYCHVNPFGSDEKPQKRMARKMLAMVSGVAKNFYGGGDTPIQCYNCHQGHPKPPEGTGL